MKTRKPDHALAHVALDFTTNGTKNAEAIAAMQGQGWTLTEVDEEAMTFTKPVDLPRSLGGGDPEPSAPAHPLARRRTRRGRKPKPAAAAASEDEGGAYVTVRRGDGTTYKRKKRRFFRKPGRGSRGAGSNDVPAGASVPALKQGQCPMCDQATKKIITCKGCGRRGCRERCNNTGKLCPDCTKRQGETQ